MNGRPKRTYGRYTPPMRGMATEPLIITVTDDDGQVLDEFETTLGVGLALLECGALDVKRAGYETSAGTIHQLWPPLGDADASTVNDPRLQAGAVRGPRR